MARSTTTPVPPSDPAPTREVARSPRWNPYLVGVGLGILSWVAFAVVDKPLGMSTAISEISRAATAVVAGSTTVEQNAYWKANRPAWNYGTLFLVGTFLGALASALVSRDFRVETVPSVWRERFGPSPALRLGAAFFGGIVIMYGARMAGGCTSGHGISGSLQLALSSWIFFLTMFVFGVLTALALFGKPGPVGRA